MRVLKDLWFDFGIARWVFKKKIIFRGLLLRVTLKESPGFLTCSWQCQLIGYEHGHWCCNLTNIGGWCWLFWLNGFHICRWLRLMETSCIIKRMCNLDNLHSHQRSQAITWPASGCRMHPPMWMSILHSIGRQASVQKTGHPLPRKTS